MATSLENELVALNALRRVFSRSGLGKEASVKLALRVLPNLNVMAKEALGKIEEPGGLEKLFAGYRTLIPNDALRGAVSGALPGAVAGGAYEAFRQRDPWEADPELSDLWNSAAKGGLLGGTAGTLLFTSAAEGAFRRPSPQEDLDKALGKKK